MQTVAGYPLLQALSKVADFRKPGGGVISWSPFWPWPVPQRCAAPVV